MTDLYSMTYEEVEAYVTTAGEPGYRGDQLFGWIHKKQAASLDEMSNLPKTFRDKIQKDFPDTRIRKTDCLISKIDGTRKYLFELYDGNVIESVFMKYHHGNSVCISSQAGCRMGCRFCASTLGGLDRNLLPGEMLGQIYEIQRDTGERISHVVIMGTGEPLDNFDGFLRFVSLITDPKGQNISQRNMTVSTCGLVPEIYKLAKEHLQLTLAVSLHASNDKDRKKIMPIAEKYSMKEVLLACKDYFKTTGRRITFEYSLIAGINDRKEQAEELSAYLHGFACHVNLIPVNPVKERGFDQPIPDSVNEFKNILEKNCVNVTIRRETGRDIQAACGQLRRIKLTERECKI